MEGPRSLTPSELPSLADLVDTVFMGGDKGKMGRCFPALFNEANCENLLAYVDEGRVVSHFGMTQRWASLGGAVVRVACVGAVSTYPEYRGRGLASTLLKTACDRAFDAGVDFMMISGGLELYRRAGATEVGREWRVSIPKAVAGPCANSSITVRPALSSDLSFCANVYATKRAHFIRPRDDWDWFFASQICGAKPVDTLIVECAGKPCGYVIHFKRDDATIEIAEFAGNDWAIASAMDPILAHCCSPLAEIHLQCTDLELRDQLEKAGAHSELETSHGTLLLINPSQLVNRLRPYIETVLGITADSEFTLTESNGAFAFRLGSEAITVQEKIAAARMLFGSWDCAPPQGLLSKVLPIPSLWYGLNYV